MSVLPLDLVADEALQATLIGLAFEDGQEGLPYRDWSAELPPQAWRGRMLLERHLARVWFLGTLRSGLAA